MICGCDHVLGYCTSEENGKHSLKCEEPEKAASVHEGEVQQMVSPRSCRSTTSVSGCRTGIDFCGR